MYMYANDLWAPSRFQAMRFQAMGDAAMGHSWRTARAGTESERSLAGEQTCRERGGGTGNMAERRQWALRDRPIRYGVCLEVGRGWDAACLRHRKERRCLNHESSENTGQKRCLNDAESSATCRQTWCLNKAVEHTMQGGVLSRKQWNTRGKCGVLPAGSSPCCAGSDAGRHRTCSARRHAANEGTGRRGNRLHVCGAAGRYRTGPLPSSMHWRTR